MNIHVPQQAKILSHAVGMGTPSPDLVRKRAREVALIEGRIEPNQEDWRQAKAELHGGHATNGDEEGVTFVSEREMILGGVGHQAPRYGFEGDESVVEELIAEGMDEAVHEQMLESRLQENEESEEE